LRDDNYCVDLDELEKLSRYNYDLIALVNPNSPTGQHIPCEEMEKLLRQIPTTTRIWIDETYVEFAGVDQSLEKFAAKSKTSSSANPCSKVYALSGVRAAYLCGPAEILEELRP